MENTKPKSKIDRTNIDELYQKINELIDGYFTWNIKPSALKNYLKKGSIGLKKFIQNNSLDSYENIEKVIEDVVDDRYSLELDGVRKFENFDFKIDENIEQSDVDKVLYTNIKPSDITYEKILADLYRTSLSHIVEEDIKKHIYTAVTSDDTHLVIIFNRDDLEVIKKNIVDHSFDYLNQIDIKMESLFLKFNLKGKLDKNLFETKMIEENKDMKVEDWISDVLDVEEYQFKSEYKGFFIWEK